MSCWRKAPSAPYMATPRLMVSRSTARGEPAKKRDCSTAPRKRCATNWASDSALAGELSFGDEREHPQQLRVCFAEVRRLRREQLHGAGGLIASHQRQNQS